MAAALGAVLLPRATVAQRAPASKPVITAQQREAGLTFDPSVDPASRATIAQAIAGARPEARRLIDIVDGLVTVRLGRPGGNALGTTQGTLEGFDIVLDLGSSQRQAGPRGINRVVLHELGHVVDFALVPDAVNAELDAKIPAGVPCPAGTPLGSCAPKEERFAETFARWAMGNDLGANLYIGYAVPPPSIGFDAWALPLAELS